MKLTRTIIKSLTAICLIPALAVLTACSNDSDDENDKTPAVSLEGTSLYGSLLDARFVGAHTAYITMHGSILSEDENLYTYQATPTTLTFQMQKICAPDGSGRLVTENDYIGYWNSKDFRFAHIITNDITSWYESETLTCTATDGTVYTFINKTSYTKTGDETTSVMTTNGKIKANNGIESPLFEEVPGYTEFESEYSASEFTNVVSVHVYKITTNIEDEEEVVNIAPYTGYPIELVGAAIGETKTTLGSDDAATQEEIEEQQAIFDSRYNELSANDWAIVKSAFKPYSFSYEKNKTVTESYINDDDTYNHEDVTYDYYLTQHYSVPENAIFIYGDDASAAEKTIATFSGLRGMVSTVDANEKVTIYDTIDAATTADTLIFTAVPANDEDDESESDTYVDIETISANYVLDENGDKTTLTITFETKTGFTVSDKTITMEYSPVTDGLMISD
ncbi:hypothetical protein [uncultured Treponema sp.]|uniref:hypothetical protein n=1 Tax=uncultured Treponema sp. TaxID=162155 RepID=UPI0025F8F0F0|nr:hypothetical protein [uncultured Treponema sp.]